MDINAPLLDWNAPGTPPPQSLKDNGWMAGDKPAAGHFNALFYAISNILDEVVTKGATEEWVNEKIEGITISLIDSYTSTSKTQAPTADALRGGLETKQDVLRLADNFVSASKLINDTTAPVYPNGVSMFKVSSAAGGWPAANGYVLTFRAGSGGYQIFYEMYTGTTQSDKTARQWTRSKRDSNTFWQDWARVMTEADLVDTTSSTDKTRAGTADSVRRAKEEAVQTSRGVIDSRNVNTLPNSYTQGTTREFKLASVIGFGSSDTFVFVETKRPWVDDTAGLSFQVGYGMQSGKIQVRTSGSGGASWNAWSEDLFTSVVNGKNDVKQAGISKGGTFNQAGSVPTFAELVSGINSIILGYKATPGEVVLQSLGTSGSNGSSSYARQFLLRTNVPGTFRLRYTVSNSGSGLGYARVYKNGVPFGVERVVNPGNPTTVSFVEDLSFSVGDTIEFWTRAQTTNSNLVSLIDVRVLGSTFIFSTT